MAATVRLSFYFLDKLKSVDLLAVSFSSRHTRRLHRIQKSKSAISNELHFGLFSHLFRIYYSDLQFEDCNRRYSNFSTKLWWRKRQFATTTSQPKANEVHLMTTVPKNKQTIRFKAQEFATMAIDVFDF